MSVIQRLLVAGFIIPLTVVLDQWSKAAILAEPRFNALDCLDRSEYCGRIVLENIPVVDLSMVWNYGMSFGSFQSEGIWRWVLVLVACAIAAGFAVWLFRATYWLTVVALSFVVAGAVGNVIDRVRFGAVVDFIDVYAAIPFFPWVFNVADSAVTVGAVLLLIDQFILSQNNANDNA